MQKYADYIRRIEIDSLWSGKKHVVWELNRQVNILSGINGVGKSTILNKVVKSVNSNGDIINHLLRVFILMLNRQMPRISVLTSSGRLILPCLTMRR